MQEQLTVDRNMQLGGLTTPYKAESGLEFIEKVIACNIEGKDVILNVETTNCEKSAVILRGYISGIVQVTLVPQGEVVAGRFSLVKNKAEQVAPVLRENEGQVCIDYNNFKLIINKAPWEMTCLNNDDNLILKEHRSDTDLYGNRRVKWLGYQRTNGGVSKVFNAFYAAYDEHFYGTGEKFIPLDKRGARIENWNFNTWGSTNERSYKNIPFFMSTRGYGLFIDTTCRTKFDFASGLESSISLTIEAEDTILDYYIILGPEFPSIIEKYTEMMGRAVVPPKWSFGLWMSRFGYRSRKEVEEVVSKLREYVIPADVIHLDPYWMKDRMYADLIWDEEAFPNPEEMIKNLKNMGFHVCLWVHPWIPKDSPVFKEAAEKGYFAKRKDETTYIFIPTIPGDKPNPCGIVDFSNPEARAWYKKRLKELIAMGVRAFKTDFGEAIPEDACFYEGSGRYIHNKYPLLYNSLFYEAFAECGVQGLVWQRSGWAGIQNWPVSWSGDMLCNFPSFVCTIWGGLNYALSGVPFWSNDIGGFKGTPSPELYIRWAQFGLLSSFSRCHGTTPREPWVFGEKVLQIFKKYDELRYRLIPYLYSYAWVAAKTGLPVMRPLVLHYQEDILAREFDTEYLLGKEILVAPVTDECEERTVYLPAGKWVDFWSDEIYDGNQIIKYNAPMDKIPLFIRLNSIIPTTKVVQHIEDGVSDPLILDVYVEDRAEFTLQEAEHGVIEIVATKTDSQIDVEIPDISRNLVLRIHHCPNPTDITYNGKVLSPDVWTYQDSILTVKVIVSGLVKIRIDLITRN